MITVRVSDGALTADSTFTVTVAASTPPNPPRNLSASVRPGNVIELNWLAPLPSDARLNAGAGELAAAVTGYTIEVGRSPGQATSARSRPV